MELKNIFENENEKPLDTIPEDGGYTAIFRTIACVGDSLSSGEFEANNGNGGSSYHECTSIRGDSFWGAHAEVRSIIYPAEECPQRNTATPLPMLTATGIRNMPRSAI